MTTSDHESYAKELLRAATQDRPKMDGPHVVTDKNQTRNAARAMTAVLCHRILQSSKIEPVRKANTTYEWNGGAFNSRNTSERDYLWTNIRREGADKLHETAHKGLQTNRSCNGLLLRTDLHTLFDLKLIAVDAKQMTVLVSPRLVGTCYDAYRGRKISISEHGENRPSEEALEQHRRESSR